MLVKAIIRKQPRRSADKRRIIIQNIARIFDINDELAIQPVAFIAACTFLDAGECQAGFRGNGFDLGKQIVDRLVAVARHADTPSRSEEHTSELQSLMRISYAVFCLKK